MFLNIKHDAWTHVSGFRAYVMQASDATCQPPSAMAHIAFHTATIVFLLSFLHATVAIERRNSRGRRRRRRRRKSGLICPLGLGNSSVWRQPSHVGNGNWERSSEMGRRWRRERWQLRRRGGSTDIEHLFSGIQSHSTAIRDTNVTIGFTAPSGLIHCSRSPDCLPSASKSPAQFETHSPFRDRASATWRSSGFFVAGY